MPVPPLTLAQFGPEGDIQKASKTEIQTSKALSIGAHSKTKKKHLSCFPEKKKKKKKKKNVRRPHRRSHIQRARCLGHALELSDLHSRQAHLFEVRGQQIRHLSMRGTSESNGAHSKARLRGCGLFQPKKLGVSMTL